MTLDQELHNLILALEPVGDVIVDERDRIITDRSVARINSRWIPLSQQTKRAEIAPHVAIRWKDRGRSGTKNRVTRKQIPRSGQEAEVLGGVARRCDCLQRFGRIDLNDLSIPQLMVDQ